MTGVEVTRLRFEDPSFPIKHTLTLRSVPLLLDRS